LEKKGTTKCLTGKVTRVGETTTKRISSLGVTPNALSGV